MTGIYQELINQFEKYTDDVVDNLRQTCSLSLEENGNPQNVEQLNEIVDKYSHQCHQNIKKKIMSFMDNEEINKDFSLDSKSKLFNTDTDKNEYVC
ncbi:hypothetical protein A3Q56_06117 [Intoshia linei]|uniref:Uncharacterized protein n=1 Tax=Intoshia linei TaxID=1819745 RepID=A0A177AXR4_9BILA|nr:hypothetical protein A3Q56_06117 [Intoshia linei]